METFLTLMMWLAFGGASAYYAKKQGRNPYIWFFVGLFLGIFGLLLLLMLPLMSRFKNSMQAKKEPPKPSPVISPIGSILMNAASDEHKNLMWYYVNGASEQKGPMSFTAFDRDWQEGKLMASNFVWNELLTEWKTFKEIFPNVGHEQR
jgi:hypothetical protein